MHLKKSIAIGYSDAFAPAKQEQQMQVKDHMHEDMMYKLNIN